MSCSVSVLPVMRITPNPDTKRRSLLSTSTVFVLTINELAVVGFAVLLPNTLCVMKRVLPLRVDRLPSLPSILVFNTEFRLSSVRTLDWVRAVVSMFVSLVIRLSVAVFNTEFRFASVRTLDWVRAVVSMFASLVIRLSIAVFNTELRFASLRTLDWVRVVVSMFASLVIMLSMAVLRSWFLLLLSKIHSLERPDVFRYRSRSRSSSSSPCSNWSSNTSSVM